MRTAIALPSSVVDRLPRDQAVLAARETRKGQLGDVDRRMHGGVGENADAERAKPLSKHLRVRLLVRCRQDKRPCATKLLDLGEGLAIVPNPKITRERSPGKTNGPNRCHVRSILACRYRRARRLRNWTVYVRSFVSVQRPR